MVASRNTTKNSVLFLTGLIAMVGLLQPALLSSSSLLALAHPTAGASTRYGSLEGLVRRNGPEDFGYISVQRRADGDSTDATPSADSDTSDATPSSSDTSNATPSSGDTSGATPTPPDEASNSYEDTSSVVKDAVKDAEGVHGQIKDKIGNIVGDIKQGTSDSYDQAKNEANDVVNTVKDNSQSSYDKYKPKVEGNSDLKNKIGKVADNVKSKIST